MNMRKSFLKHFLAEPEVEKTTCCIPRKLLGQWYFLYLQKIDWHNTISETSKTSNMWNNFLAFTTENALVARIFRFYCELCRRR